MSKKMSRGLQLLAKILLIVLLFLGREIDKNKKHVQKQGTKNKSSESVENQVHLKWKHRIIGTHCRSIILVRMFTVY